MSSNYVFIGHGWNLDNSIDLQRYNCTVVMLSSTSCLFEENGVKHKQLITVYGSDPQKYIEKLFQTDKKEPGNIFCTYRNIAPELLLTTLTKRGELSATFLQKIGKISSEPVNKVFLLSEILEILTKKENGQRFVLIIYACRCPLDHFQYENMYQFGAENILETFIKNKKIRILNKDEKGSQPECEKLDLQIF